MLKNPDNIFSIVTLCKWAKVSRSGFYTFNGRKQKVSKKELRDRADFELILEAYKFRGYDKGNRGIKMRLERMGHPMGRDKIRRLMHKFGLVCPIRKPNPYKQAIKKLEESTVAPNILQREFREHGPRYVLLTDITYLFYGNGQKCYVSSIKDAYTKEILAYVLSDNMYEEFVLETIRNLIRDHKSELPQLPILNSDQGIHYKAKSFKELLSQNEILRSMSRKANCWDNAPKESFFGHMKDEIDITNCNTFEEVKDIIDDYMDYYNTDRPQWELAKLTPVEYYHYSITGQYPLEVKEVKYEDPNENEE